MNERGVLPKIFIVIIEYTFGAFQALLYTPIVLSLWLFAFLIAISFTNDLTPLRLLFPSGTITNVDLLGWAAKIAFGISLALTFLEIMFKKRFMMSEVKKMKFLVFSMVVIYLFSFILLVVRFKMDVSFALFFALVSFVSTLPGIFFGVPIEWFMNLLDRAERGERGSMN